MISTSCYSCTGVISSPCMGTWPSDSILISRVWQKWWDVIPKNRLHRDCGFQLFHNWLPAFFHNFSHVHFDESHLLDCELPYGEAHVDGQWGWALAKGQWKVDGLSPTNHKGLCPGNTMIERLEMMLSRAFEWDCSPDQQIDWSLVKDLEAEAPCWPALRFLTNRDGENKWLLFYATKFWGD